MPSTKESKETWREKLDKCLHDKDCRFATYLGVLEQKTGIERTKFVMGLCGVLALYLVIGYGKDFLCNLIGFVYPAYASVKAIESKEKDDDTKWLTYWVVYSVFLLVESCTDFFLSWIPLYFLLKCVFLLFCMAPVTWNGSVMIYKKFIRPFVLQHQKDVDTGLQYASEIGKEVFAGAKEAGEKAFVNTLIDNVSQMKTDEDLMKYDNEEDEGDSGSHDATEEEKKDI